jgi:hypothetical protein
MFQKEIYNGSPNVIVWRVLRKRLYLKACKLSIVQHFERWIVFTSSSVNVFVTLTKQQHLIYHCKVLFETPCITSEVTLNHNYYMKNGVVYYIMMVQNTVHVPWINLYKLSKL